VAWHSGDVFCVLVYDHVNENTVYAADYYRGDNLCKDSGKEQGTCAYGSATAETSNT